MDMINKNMGEIIKNLNDSENMVVTMMNNQQSKFSEGGRDKQYESRPESQGVPNEPNVQHSSNLKELLHAMKSSDYNEPARARARYTSNHGNQLYNVEEEEKSRVEGLSRENEPDAFKFKFDY